MTSARAVLPLRLPSTPDPSANDRERELIVRIRADDQEAFAEVFHTYNRQLCSFACRYAGSRELAADIVQDVFLWIWRQRHSWEVRGALRIYLYRAVRNRALDILKHQAIERRRAAEAKAEHRALAMGQGAAPPDRALDLDTLALAVERALADMPERRRQIFLLRWKHGLSYAEVGAQLGIKVKTVENQLSRVLHFLRERLASERS